MTNPQVGAWVKARRQAQKLSIVRAVELSGISRQTWYSLEGGQHPPSVDTQRGVAIALDIGVDWYDRLLAGEEPTEAGTPAGTELELSRLEAVVAAQGQRVEELTETVDTLIRQMGARLDRLEQERDEASRHAR